MDTSTHLSLHFIGHRIAALESLSADTAATETFVIFRQLENVFFRVINNFKLNLSRGFTDFKRSELRSYQESYRGNVRELFTQKKWINLSHLSIPVSKSMHRPYLISSEHVAELLKESRYSEALAHMATALASPAHQDASAPDIKAATDALYQLWGTQGYVPDKNRLEPYIDFKDRGQIEFPARDVFADLEEVERTAEVILGYESYFTETVTSQKSLQDLEKAVDALVSKLEHGGAISEAYVSNFHQLISTFATFLDAYALYLQAGQVVEHCFVLSLKVFAKA